MKIGFTAALILFAAFQIAQAVSIAPEIVAQLRASGQLETIVEADRIARQNGVWGANPNPYRPNAATDIDTLHCLIILVDFSDMPHESGFNAEPYHFDSLLFSVNISNPGSMTDYYLENSYGRALLVGQVTRWYRMPQPYSYYVNGQRGFGTYPRNAQKLTEDAITAADPDVNFNLYDNDDDGYVDALFVVHAGPGYEDTGNLNYIHSHAWVISQPTWVDDVIVYHYSMEPEETGSRALISIGVFCHEFGHVLGLPDLYDYGYDSDGVGMWSIMASGSWGGGGRRPVHFDGWSKLHLGFVNPTVLQGNRENEQIDAVEYSPDVYVLFSRGLYSNQYFLVENRQRVEFDLSLPGSGLVIYHVDESVPNNNNQNHYKVAVEQADGEFDLEHNRGSDSGDPWPGSLNRRTFDDYSIPNSNLYGGAESEISIDNISDSDSVMFADLAIISVNPLFRLLSLSFIDTAGNGNGRPDAGETCDLVFSATNVRAQIDNFTVTARCNDRNVTFLDSVSQFGYIPVNQPFDNANDRIRFSLPVNYQSRFVEIVLDFSAHDGGYHQLINRRVIFGLPEITLVDDDNGAAIDTYYTRALDSLDFTWQRWDISSQGSPFPDIYQARGVIWFTGDTRATTIPENYVAGLITYLNQGGRLLMTSQDFVQLVQQRGSTQDLFLLNNLLKLRYDTLSISYVADGLSGFPFEGQRYVTTGPGGEQNQHSQDALVALDGGTPILKYFVSNKTAAVGVQSNYRALTVGFGIEGIDVGHPQSATRADFLNAGLRYLGFTTSIDEDEAMAPETFSLNQNYPNPFNAYTLISYRLATTASVKLDIYDLTGRLVERLVEYPQSAGSYSVRWNAAGYSSGIYFYRLQIGEESVTKRMLLIK